jgi:ERF superfamily
MTDTDQQEEAPSIHVLMSRVQSDSGAIGKTSTGDVPYKFRGIDAVVNALNPAMVNHGVFCVPEVRSYEHERLANGRAHLVMLTMAYRFYGPRGDYVEAVGIGESVDYSDKATNQAMSMAYKYAMTETFCIRTQDMTDADARSVEIPEHSGQPSRPGGKSKRSQAAKPVADPVTGEIQVNMTKEVMAAVPASDRPDFFKWVEEKHGIAQIAKVPASKEKDVREAIEARSRGDQLPDPGRPFTDEGPA